MLVQSRSIIDGIKAENGCFPFILLYMLFGGKILNNKKRIINSRT